MHKAGFLWQNVTAEGIGDYIVSVRNQKQRIGMEHIGLLIIFSSYKISLHS